MATSKFDIMTLCVGDPVWGVSGAVVEFQNSTYEDYFIFSAEVQRIVELERIIRFNEERVTLEIWLDEDSSQVVRSNGPLGMPYLFKTEEDAQRWIDEHYSKSAEVAETEAREAVALAKRMRLRCAQPIIRLPWKIASTIRYRLYKPELLKLSKLSR